MPENDFYFALVGGGAEYSSVEHLQDPNKLASLSFIWMPVTVNATFSPHFGHTDGHN